ncbi:MAG: SDR family NAD(P)-dependent oxidoreductase [Alkalispirochaeta sp.]
MRILITGASDGIGYATARQLAEHGHAVVMHGRGGEKLDRAVAEVRAAAAQAGAVQDGAAQEEGAQPAAAHAAAGSPTPRESTGSAAGKVDAAVADLASLREVEDLAGDVSHRFPDLQVLILNAGVMTRERKTSHDGYELNLAVNHLAPMLLAERLLPTLSANAPARIVVVSSMVHAGATLNFDDLQFTHGYDGMQAYSASKLANIYMTHVLSESLHPETVTVNALHPGVISTKLLHEYFAGGADTHTGAATSVYLAESPEVAGVTGAYFSNRRRQETAALREPEHREAAHQLWSESHRLINRALGGVENR